MSVNIPSRVGLVLTGGGAKGAYHVGALKAIAELNIPIHAVAGASIGALNGAIVASAGNMQQAYSHLQQIWEFLATEKVVGMSKTTPAYFTMMVGMGVAFRSMPVLTAGVSLASRLAEEFGVDVPSMDGQLLDDSPLVKLLDQYTTVESLKNGLPLYVSVYETGGALDDIFGVVKSSLRLGNTRESDFLLVQSLPGNEMQQVLMASAALPLLFRAREVQGKRYTDGGQGDWYGVGGNTPVKPLVDAGLDTIIVVHLCDGSAWDRGLYPNTNIIEVRPRSFIAQGNAVADLLGFDHQRITGWAEQGYADAMHCLSRVFKTIAQHDQLISSSDQLTRALKQHENADQLLESAMKRLQ
jgi:NTE family protein